MLVSHLILRLADDLLQVVATAARSHAQLAAENLFLRSSSRMYAERRVKPRRPTMRLGFALLGLSWLIDWRHILRS